jgi:hypothetical protein
MHVILSKQGTGSDLIDLGYLYHPLPFADLILDVSSKIGRAIAFRYNAEL